MLVVRLNIGGKYMYQNNCNTENVKNKPLTDTKQNIFNKTYCIKNNKSV